MDIRQLRYFIGVLEAKSLSKASTVLHVAQPALGVQIRNLEQELGAKLLHRLPRVVVATEAGEWLARHAEELLRQFDGLKQELIDYAAMPGGSVVICVGRSMPRVVTATIAERCLKMLPDVRLKMIVGGGPQLEALSEEIGIDLVLTFRPRDDSQFISEPLIQDEFFLVCSNKGASLPQAIDFNEITERLLILPSAPNYVRHLIEAAAQRSGCKLKVYCDVDSLDTTIELVKRGVAYTILPGGWIREDLKKGHLKAARIKSPKLQRTLYMLRAQNRVHSVAADLVQREIRSVILDFAKDPAFGWKRVS